MFARDITQGQEKNKSTLHVPLKKMCLGELLLHTDSISTINFSLGCCGLWMFECIKIQGAVAVCLQCMYLTVPLSDDGNCITECSWNHCFKK